MIRKIESTDFERINNLITQFSEESVRKNLMLELQQSIDSVVEGYVLEEEGKLKGYLILRKWGGVYNLDTLIVEKNFQGMGFGKQLVEYAKRRCIDQKMPQITTRTFFVKNVEFYKRRGFVEIGVLNGPFVPLDKKRIYLKWVSLNYE